MFTRSELERLSAVTIFKWVFVGSAAVCVPISLIMGVCALFGAHTVRWGGEPMTGFVGLLVSPFLGLFVALILTASFGGAAVASLWVFSHAAADEDNGDDE